MKSTKLSVEFPNRLAAPFVDRMEFYRHETRELIGKAADAAAGVHHLQTTRRNCLVDVVFAHRCFFRYSQVCQKTDTMRQIIDGHSPRPGKRPAGQQRSKTFYDVRGLPGSEEKALYLLELLDSAEAAGGLKTSRLAASKPEK
jgi:hypothetical protein